MASRYGLKCQNADQIALTKLDVLSSLKEIPLIIAYQKGAEKITEFDLSLIHIFHEKVPHCLLILPQPQKAVSSRQKHGHIAALPPVSAEHLCWCG